MWSIDYINIQKNVENIKIIFIINPPKQSTKKEKKWGYSILRVYRLYLH